MTEQFRIVLPVRYDDPDTNGHLRGAGYLSFADHARWAAVHAAGLDVAGFAALGVGPVNLETTVWFLRELRPHDEAVVRTCSNTARAGPVGSARSCCVRMGCGPPR